MELKWTTNLVYSFFKYESQSIYEKDLKKAWVKNKIMHHSYKNFDKYFEVLETNYFWNLESVLPTRNVQKMSEKRCHILPKKTKTIPYLVKNAAITGIKLCHTGRKTMSCWPKNKFTVSADWLKTNFSPQPRKSDKLWEPCTVVMSIYFHGNCSATQGNFLRIYEIMEICGFPHFLWISRYMRISA